MCPALSKKDIKLEIRHKLQHSNCIKCIFIEIFTLKSSYLDFRTSLPAFC